MMRFVGQFEAHSTAPYGRTGDKWLSGPVTAENVRSLAVAAFTSGERPFGEPLIESCNLPAQ
jgi:hypothetical protein